MGTLYETDLFRLSDTFRGLDSLHNRGTLARVDSFQTLGTLVAY